MQTLWRTVFLFGLLSVALGSVLDPTALLNKLNADGTLFSPDKTPGSPYPGRNDGYSQANLQRTPSDDDGSEEYATSFGKDDDRGCGDFVPQCQDLIYVQSGMAKGWILPKWLPFWSNYSARINSLEDLGSSVCVIEKGCPSLHLIGGREDTDGSPWTKKTVASSFAAQDAILSLIFAMMVDRNWIQMNTTIPSVWPEFPHNVTLQQVVQSWSGLVSIPPVPKPIYSYQTRNTTYVDEIIQNMPRNLQSVLSYGVISEGESAKGWILDGILRRVDPRGRGIEKFWKQEILSKLSSEAQGTFTPKPAFDNRFAKNLNTSTSALYDQSFYQLCVMNVSNAYTQYILRLLCYNYGLPHDWHNFHQLNNATYRNVIFNPGSVFLTDAQTAAEYMSLFYPPLQRRVGWLSPQTFTRLTQNPFYNFDVLGGTGEYKTEFHLESPVQYTDGYNTSAPTFGKEGAGNNVWFHVPTDKNGNTVGAGVGIIVGSPQFGEDYQGSRIIYTDHIMRVLSGNN